MYVKLINDLKSLEKNHNQMLAIQKWMFETEMTEKYFADDKKKTDSKMNKISFENFNSACLFIT